ncbi:hypothetical protein WKK05_40175 (plasmid) [Nostoc sp. UHCC 0302]|uniref:hypothetical protein n=1 Tax=Nostoc sp. UHCC 0302 TaxID=3134896 RepID=UPI00311CCB9C
MTAGLGIKAVALILHSFELFLVPFRFGHGGDRMTKTVIAELSAILEKFLEKGVKASQDESVGCLYPYIETKKLLDGSKVFYPRVIGERDPNNPECWRWGFNWKEKHNGVWKGRSIGSIPPGAVPMIRLMQQQGATREDIIAFIKRAKTKKPSPKLDVCKNFDNTKLTLFHQSG